MINTHHIVIVGAGYAGLSMALKLARDLKDSLEKRLIKITVINNQTQHEMGDEIFRYLAKEKSFSVPLEPLLRKHHIKFIEGTLVGIDPAKKTLRIQAWSDQELGYDDLVLATGLVPQTPNLTGLENFLWPEKMNDPKKVLMFQNETDASLLKAMLRRQDWFDRLTSNQLQDKKEFFLVILGAGDLGLQLAGMLASLRGMPSKNRLILVDQKKSLASDLSPVAQKILTSQLRKLQIETVLGSPAISVGPRALHIENGQIIPWDLMVLCTGWKAPKQPYEVFTSAWSENGLKVNSNFEILGFPDHYAVGDLCEMSFKNHPLANAQMVPKGAYQARLEGHHLARELSHQIFPVKNSSPGPYESSDLGHFIALGNSLGVARLGRLRFSKMSRFLSPFLFGPSVAQAKKAFYFQHRTDLWR